MDALIAFLVAAVISFYGSMQLGLVNVAVIETTLVKGGRQAFAMALGGVLPEIPYTLLAILGTKYLGELEAQQQLIGYGVGVVMIGLGIFYLMRKPKQKALELNVRKTGKWSSFFKGFGMAMLNPQLIFFWSGILLLLETGTLNFTEQSKMINFDAPTWISPRLTFALGASIGALAILVVYILVARRFKNKISVSVQKKMNMVVGLFFIGLGLYSALRNVL